MVEKKHFAPFVQNIVFFLLLPLFLPTNWTQLEVFPGTEGKKGHFLVNSFRPDLARNVFFYSRQRQGRWGAYRLTRGRSYLLAQRLFENVGGGHATTLPRQCDHVFGPQNVLLINYVYILCSHSTLRPYNLLLFFRVTDALLRCLVVAKLTNCPMLSSGNTHPPASHIQIVSDVTNTTFLLLVYGGSCMSKTVNSMRG